MRNITGSPVEGDNFFGREEELGRLRRALEAGNHVLLLGPRRVGKSSLVAEIGRLLGDDGWVIVSLDAQHVADEAGFLHDLLESIKNSGADLPVLAQVEGAVANFCRMFRGTKIKGGGLPKAQRSAGYPSVSDVETAYQTLLDPHHRGHFAHWDSRLGDLLSPEELDTVHTILKHLCGLPQGSELDSLLNVVAAEAPHADPRTLNRDLRDVLEFLERDGYLIRNEDTFAFRSFLLRDYWQKRFA